MFASQLLLPDLLQVRAPALNFHVLRDTAGLYLLDSGFIGGQWFLRRALAQHGWQNEPILGIIATHGHLDHIHNVAPLARQAGAWIAAPQIDANHYAGHPTYQGWARVTGILEAIGRPLLGFEPFQPDRWLRDGDQLDLWDGLRAVHLPGHTLGHMGFYCEKRKLMFSADLFASYRGMTHFPPFIFNSNPARLPESARRILDFDLEGIIPNHGDTASPEEHLHRYRAMVKKLPPLA